MLSRKSHIVALFVVGLATATLANAGWVEEPHYGFTPPIRIPNDDPPPPNLPPPDDGWDGGGDKNSWTNNPYTPGDDPSPPVPVPQPGAGWLMLAGLGGLLWRYRYRTS